MFPEGKTLETPFFTYTSHYYESVATFMWVLFSKLIPLYLLTVWFFTSKNWWAPAITVPIGMYLFQIISLFNEEFKLKDEAIELIYIIPFIIIIGTALFFVRRKLMKYIEFFDLKEQINQEIEQTRLEIEK